MEVVGSTRRGKYCGTSDLYSGGLPMVPVVPSEYIRLYSTHYREPPPLCCDTTNSLATRLVPGSETYREECRLDKGT